jgi:holo-[acyl-carrier protein] synthase
LILFKVWLGILSKLSVSEKGLLMIIGIGIDLADQTRIRDGLTKHGERFLKHLFTEQEIISCQRYRYSEEHFAGKFAAKEAFMKAIATGLSQQVTFKDIEVLNYPHGAPYIVPHGMAQEIANQLGTTRIHVSISHTAQLAVAVVILEKD